MQKENEISNLTPNEILNKEFSIETRGYSVSEVDNFLDIIIEDYKLLLELNTNLSQKIARSEEYISKLRNQLSKIQNNQDALIHSSKLNTNMKHYGDNLDIIKRVSKLEEIVSKLINS